MKKSRLKLGAAPQFVQSPLHDHQTDAVLRLETAIAEYGGALLADSVGLGKTYVALAIATVAGILSSLIGFHAAYWLSASTGGAMV